MKPAETLFEETMWLLNRYGYMFFMFAQDYRGLQRHAQCHIGRVHFE